MTDTTTILKTMFFKAARETVWAFLTETNKLATWFHPTALDLAEGEEYLCVRTANDGAVVPQIWGRVLEMDRPSKLIMTFEIAPFEGRETVVTWILEEASGGTRLTLKHEGIAEASGAAALNLLLALDHGWDEHLDGLRKSAI